MIFCFENLCQHMHHLFRDHRVVEVGFARRVEFDCAGDEREERVILAHANIFARQNIRASLANNDRTGLSFVALRDLDAEVFWTRVATVFSCSRGFFMCHVGL